MYMLILIHINQSITGWHTEKLSSNITDISCLQDHRTYHSKPINKTSRNEQNLDQESIWL